MDKLCTRKINIIVKALTMILALIVSNSWGQAILPISRTSWGTTPTGWIETNTSTYGSDVCGTADASSGKFDAPGDRYMIYFASGGSALSFCIKGNSYLAGGNFDVEESIDGTTWTNVVTYNTTAAIPTTSSTKNLTLLCSSRYVRFTYTSQVGGNIAIDNLSLTKGTCCTAPTITISPTSQTICAGSVAAVTLTTTASTPSYTWQASSNGITGWANLANGTPTGASFSGSNALTLNITSGSGSTTYYYHSLVTENGTCTATSDNSMLIVNTNPTITTQPVNKTICSETNTTFGLVSTAGVTYQWQEKIPAGSFVDISNGGVYSGATTATLSLTNVPVSMNTYSYQCVLNVAGCSNTITSVVTLSVNASPASPPAPAALANPACGGTTLAAMSSTFAGVTWYWESTTLGGTSSANPTTSSYYVGASGTYYVNAKSTSPVCWSAVSSSIAITINQAPVITSEPTDKPQCVGSNTTFAVSASNATGYQWQVDDGTGFVNLSNGGLYSGVTTAVLTITGIPGGINGYKYRCIVSGVSPCSSVASTSSTLIITPSSDPTTASSSITSSNIGCNAFNLSFTKGSGSNRLVIVKSGSAVAGSPADGTNYTSSSVFGSGNTITAGEYVVYNGTGSSVFITGLSASTNYYYAVFEFNGCNYNYLTSGTVPSGNVTTISCSSPAGVTGVYIDACGSTTCPSEGSNELVWGTSGSYGMAVNNNGPTLHYNSTTAPITTYISTYSQNASNITALNAAVGACGTTTFVDPNTQGYIPPNSKFLIANNCMCSPSVYDFSGLCGAGPIYVVFGTDVSWPCNTNGGVFGNYSAGGTVRYFDLNMNVWGVALDPIYNYTIGSLSGSGDGDIILTNPAGGAAYTYSNSACKVPIVILPVELLDFYATKNGKGNEVIWKVAQEEHILHYIVEKSKDAIDFTEVATVYATNDLHNKSYSIFDNEPYRDITYYRLSTKEVDGTSKKYKIISVNEKDNNWEYVYYQTENNMVLEFKNTSPKNSVISLYDISGKELISQAIKQSQTTLNTDNISSGIYFVRLSTPYKTEHFKLIISKY